MTQPSYREWLQKAKTTLSENHISTAQLDAEIILSCAINKPRTWIHAHSDETLNPQLTSIVDAMLSLRQTNVPIAYITGYKEFYGRTFHVSPSVLVPRPETENLVEYITNTYRDKKSTIIEVGTGSGIIAISLSIELPDSNITAIDISDKALAVAQKNAESHHQTSINFMRNDLLSGITIKADCIVANLPYVDPTWRTNDEVLHEPDLALYAKQNGLELIKKLIYQASNNLKPKGQIVLEADPRQFASIKKIAKDNKYNIIAQKGYMIVLQKN